MASMNARPQVLVVGAGPTGLTMAAELLRRGIACRLIDKAPSPSPWSRAIGIQARTLELFENMGIVEPFTTLGHKSHGVRMHAQGREILHIAFDELDSPYAYLLFLPQSETERLLTAHLESLGGQIERAVELTALTLQSEGVEATLRHGDGQMETIEVPWLIGCDGAHSAVRRLLNLPFTGRTEKAHFLLADVGLQWKQSDSEFYGYLHEEGLLIIFPMGQGRYRIIADNPPQEASEAHPEPTPAECQAIVDRRGPGYLPLSDLRWSSYFRINYRMVSQFRQGGVFLAGDSANIHSPAGAQGMNTGIQDAFNLAWKLALVNQEAADPALLERYPVERNVQRQSELLTEMASLKQPWAQALRDHLLPLLVGVGAVQELLRRTIAELEIHYRHSPIVEDHALGGSVVAGDRAPDALMLRADTKIPTRLWQILQSGQSTLLLLSGSSLQPGTLDQLQQIGAEIEGRYGPHLVPCLITASSTVPAEGNGLRLLDPEQTLHRRYGGGRPGFYLVRPDGYIGFRGALTDADHLRSYLARLFSKL